MASPCPPPAANYKALTPVYVLVYCKRSCHSDRNMLSVDTNLSVLYICEYKIYTLYILEKKYNL